VVGCGQKDFRTEEKALASIQFKLVRMESKISKHVLISLLLLVIRAWSQGSGCTAAIRLFVHTVS
jgi:hypothetical protein